MAFEVDDDRSLLEDTIKELISAMKIETGICFIRRQGLDKWEIMWKSQCRYYHVFPLLYKSGSRTSADWISLFLSKWTSSGLCPIIKFLFNGYSSNGLKTVRRMAAVLSSFWVHTKRMRTYVFRLKTDPVLSSNYSSALKKRLVIKSCSILIMRSKLQNITVLLWSQLTLMPLSVQYNTSNS